MTDKKLTLKELLAEAQEDHAMGQEESAWGEFRESVNTLADLLRAAKSNKQPEAEKNQPDKQQDRDGGIER